MVSGPDEVAPSPSSTLAPDEDSLLEASGSGTNASSPDVSKLSDAVVDRAAVRMAELAAKFLLAAGRFNRAQRFLPHHKARLL